MTHFESPSGGTGRSRGVGRTARFQFTLAAFLLAALVAGVGIAVGNPPASTSITDGAVRPTAPPASTVNPGFPAGTTLPVGIPIGIPGPGATPPGVQPASTP